MPQVKYPRKPGKTRRKTKSTRLKPSSELKPITPRYVSYAPSDVAARHPKAAKFLALAMFALFAAWILPKLDQWYLDWRTPERLIVDDLTSNYEYIEDHLCGHFGRGTLTVRDAPVCEGACSRMQTVQIIDIARASDFVNMVCFGEEPDPEQNVDAIFTAMAGSN